jgi:CubicO group peptidase (beta-lactamase class C family)
MKAQFLLLFSTVTLGNFAQNLYFPPNTGSTWETLPPESLNWCPEKIDLLNTFLEDNNTKAFILLKDGKIVIESYFDDHTMAAPWYWASAGKTLTAALVGIAQQEKLLSTKDRTQKFLGEGWTSMPNKQERNIRLIHHLSFTTGLDDKVSNLDDPSSANLKFLAKPGTRWSYHNASYTLLEKVLINASGKDYQIYFKEKLGDKIGMKGFWQQTGINNVFFSDARSFARFGLLMLANGNWNGDMIWSGDYFEKMTQTSQNLNLSYGYLTWLNGKGSYMLPGPQSVIPGSLIPQAPSDMYQAIGKSGQFLMVVPSRNLVIIRMGSSASDSPVPYVLMREIWQRFEKVQP